MSIFGMPIIGAAYIIIVITRVATHHRSHRIRVLHFLFLKI